MAVGKFKANKLLLKHTPTANIIIVVIIIDILSAIDIIFESDSQLRTTCH